MTAHEVLVNKKLHRVKVLGRNGNTFLVKVNEKTIKARIENPSPGKTTIIEIDGKSFQTRVERIEGGIFQIKIGRKIFEVQHQPEVPNKNSVKLEPVAAIKRGTAIGLAIEKDAVIAPIAGRILLLKATVGHKVEKGECICILEAMKMQNEIAAPRTGVLKEIRVSEGAFVKKGDVLAVIT